MIVLTTGGRAFRDRARVFAALDNINRYGDVSHLIEGGAPGADALAREWATRAGVQVVECPANWLHWGASAGPRRNLAMLRLRPDVVLAFPGGNGTASMVDVARKGGVRVVEVSAVA